MPAWSIFHAAAQIHRVYLRHISLFYAYIHRRFKALYIAAIFASSRAAASGENTVAIAFYDDRRCANERLNAGAIASCAWRGMS